MALTMVEHSMYYNVFSATTSSMNWGEIKLWCTCGRDANYLRKTETMGKRPLTLKSRSYTLGNVEFNKKISADYGQPITLLVKHITIQF